jgi:putative ABC transport system permease protein
MSGGASLLLPPGLVPPALLAASPTRSFVSVDAGADPAAVRSALAALGPVSDLDSWLNADAAARASTNDKVLLMVMGLGGLYALIGVVNSVVIGAAARRREFAEARVTGLTRGQVARSALMESSAVTAAGLVLGVLAAGATYVAVLTTTSAVTGSATLDVPWSFAVGIAALTLVVTSATSLITSWSATRRPPVTLLHHQ